MNRISFKYWKTWWNAFVKGYFNTLPFFKHNTYAPFIILGHPRTGTSLLHTYLNAHPSILSLNEVLKENAEGTMIFKYYSKRIQYVGFKFFYAFCESPEKMKLLQQFLKKDGAKIIKIKRANYLRTVVSLKIAEQTNQWSSTGSATGEESLKKIELSKKEFLLNVENYKKWEAVIDTKVVEGNIPVYYVEYTDLVDKPNEVLENVQEFLKVSVKQLSSLLVKQNPEPLSDLIVNFESLKKEFEGTEYHTFFME